MGIKEYGFNVNKERKMKLLISKYSVRNPMIFQLLMGGIALFLVLSGCGPEKSGPLSREKHRELANVLYNQQLYSQAVDEYVEYLNNYSLDEKERANISYMIANIYFDRLNDYENALAYYLRIKYLYPESSLQNEVSKKMVACLENMERSVEAQQMVEQTAALDESQKPKSAPGEVIARIGNREITTGDLQYEINTLPVYVRDQLKTKDQKIEFLKNYIAQELLFDSAKRKGLDKDRDVREGIRRVEKSLMAQKLFEQEIAQEVNLENYTNADVEVYFKANKEKYAEKDEKGKVIKNPSFSEVQQRVAQDFIQEKQQEAYQNLIERLMSAESVEIYEEKFN
jgi:peptidyl-prolyl cis-trans isomerase C